MLAMPRWLDRSWGDDCLFDRIDTTTSDIFFCWTWMWNPDFLHLMKRMTIFLPGASQSPYEGDCCSEIGWFLRHLRASSSA
jgi:hypothetical protein